MCRVLLAILGWVVLSPLFPALATDGPTTRQVLVVAAGYWRAGDAKTMTYDLYDLDAGGRRIHRAGPEQVGEIRGLACSPATQRLFVSGHEGLLCYGWADKARIWRKPVEGAKSEQNDALAITLDGQRLYTIRHFGKGLNVYDAITGDRLRVIHDQEKHAWGRFSQVSHDGTRLFAGKCDGTSGEVFIIATADDRMLGRFKPVMEPVRFALTPDGQSFVYPTGQKRSLAINAAADGALRHEIAVPAWEGVILEKAPLKWMALSPDGRQAWVCDPANACLHRFDLAAEPPAYLGRNAVEKGTEGLMFSVDGRFLVTGKGVILSPLDGTVIGHLTDEAGKPVSASNNLLALETDAAGTRILRTNQQCAPAWGETGAKP
jgi:DNA-binding beta-propeller fold protein YncE